MHVHWREHSLRTQKLKQKTASWHCSRPLAGPEELSGEPNTSSTAYVIFVSQPELHVGKDASITEAPNCNSGVHRGQRQLSHSSPGYLCHRSGFCPRAVVRESPCPTLSLQATLAMAHGGHSHTGPGAHSPGAGASLPTTSHTQPWPQNPCQAAQLASPALGITLGNCSLLACFGKTKWEIHGQNTTNGVTSTQVCIPGQRWQGIIWQRKRRIIRKRPATQRHLSGVGTRADQSSTWENLPDLTAELLLALKFPSYLPTNWIFSCSWTCEGYSSIILPSFHVVHFKIILKCCTFHGRHLAIAQSWSTSNRSHLKY